MVSKYDEWTVQELKEALKERKLPVSGKKRELIERLLSGDGEEGTEFELFIGRVKSEFVWAMILMVIITLFVTFLVTGNPDQIEGFESGASGVAIDDDNFVYITQQDAIVKYSVIEDDDGTLSLKEEYLIYLSNSFNSDVTHLFVVDNYVYAVKSPHVYMIEDSGHNFSVVSSKELVSTTHGFDYGSGIVVSGDYVYVSISRWKGDDSVEVYDVSNNYFKHMGTVHYETYNSGEGDELYIDGYIKGLATNDEYLYALINSCFDPDSKRDENPFPFFCKDHIYVWKLETIENLIDDPEIFVNGAVPVDSSMTMRGFLWFKQWYSTIGAHDDYVYLGDDGWGTGVVIVDFSDLDNPKKVHSYGRNIDEYPSGKHQGAGIAANDDFIVVSTRHWGYDNWGYNDGSWTIIAGSSEGLYIGKIDGDGDGVPLGKDSFPGWKYFNSNWELWGFLILILGLPLLILDGRGAITSQRIKKVEYKAEAELHIAKLKDTIDKLKSKGIEGANLEKVLAQCEAEMELATSFSFRKAGKMAQNSLTVAKEMESKHKTIGKKIDKIKEKIMEFKEKGVNTDELKKVLEEAEKNLEKWILN